MAATKQPSSSNNNTHEDYIDMEVTSSSNLLCCSSSPSSPPPHTREFEFQKCSLSHDKESTTSPADELFYKGKLLPLHLPPRIEMVQKLLRQGSNAAATLVQKSEENNTCNAISTPFDSCNVSPSESCRISRELNPDEHIFGWTNETSSLVCDCPKKSWSKKLKQIKQSSLGQKLKASRAYFRSFFTKSGCSDESTCNLDTHKGQEKRSTSFGTLDERYQTISSSLIADESITHRRSFSGVIQRHCSAPKCSSASSSSGSSSSSSSFSHGFCDLQLLKRSSSASSEIEISIQEAIAHCKQSQHLLSPTKKITHCSLSTPRIASCGDQERAGFCRI